MSELITPQRAVELLARGEVVAVPTDTVYGVAASLDQPKGIAALFSLKRRPGSVALPVLVANVNQIEALGVTWSESAAVLSRAFWPGALTIVVAAPEELARRIGSSFATVGFRIPDHDLLREILRDSGPLAVTSANEHGEPPCHSAQQVLSVFSQRDELAGIVDGGEGAGRVSTVVNVSEEAWRLVRAGAISAREIESVLNQESN